MRRRSPGRRPRAASPTAPTAGSCGRRTAGTTGRSRTDGPVVVDTGATGRRRSTDAAGRRPAVQPQRRRLRRHGRLRRGCERARIRDRGGAQRRRPGGGPRLDERRRLGRHRHLGRPQQGRRVRRGRPVHPRSSWPGTGPATAARRSSRSVAVYAALASTASSQVRVLPAGRGQPGQDHGASRSGSGPRPRCPGPSRTPPASSFARSGPGRPWRPARTPSRGTVATTPGPWCRAGPTGPS